MLGIAIILFRETFEAALLIGVVAAATRTFAGRGRWICGGIFAGLAGACIVAALAGEIAALFEGVGQQLFNAAILGAAVLLLGWHNIWMPHIAANLWPPHKALATMSVLAGAICRRY